MKKLYYIRVLNIVAALLFAVSLMFGSALQVRAAENMLRIENPRISYMASDWTALLGAVPKGYDENTGFYIFESKSFSNVKCFAFGSNIDYFETIQYLPNVYDYYVILTAYSECSVSEFTFKPSYIDVVFNNCDGNPRYDIDDLECYHHDKSYFPYTGFTVTFKLPEVNSTSIASVDMFDEGVASLPSTDINVKMEIVKVEKNQSIGELGVLADKLEEINNSIIEHENQLHQDMNELQQTMEEQMTQSSEQHNELINGYENDVLNDANEEFVASAGELNSIEKDLSNTGMQYVSDFTAEGFDLGILATIGSSMVFVTTWFTNFWNMGGIWTAGLNFCFALTIVFFIFRFKR